MTRAPVGPPRGVLRRSPGAAGVHHQRLAPAPALAGSVAHFWTVSWDLRGRPPEAAATLPHPSVHVIFEGARAQVAGVVRGRFARRLEGRGCVFGVKFRPAAFQPLLGAPMSGLTDRRVPARAIFGRAAADLSTVLAAEPRFEARVLLAEAFLSERVRPLPAAVLRA